MTGPAALRVGDVIPCVGPVDRELLRIANSRRGRLHAASASTSMTAAAHEARKILSGHALNAERAADPVEQAKTHLRRLGWNVYDAGVIHGPPDHFVIGLSGEFHSRSELFDIAERRGWKGAGR